MSQILLQSRGSASKSRLHATSSFSKGWRSPGLACFSSRMAEGIPLLQPPTQGNSEGYQPKRMPVWFGLGVRCWVFFFHKGQRDAFSSNLVAVNGGHALAEMKPGGGHHLRNVKFRTPRSMPGGAAGAGGSASKRGSARHAQRPRSLRASRCLGAVPPHNKKKRKKKTIFFYPHKTRISRPPHA